MHESSDIKWKKSIFHSFRKRLSRRCVVIENITIMKHSMTLPKHALRCARCSHPLLILLQSKPRSINGLLTKHDGHLKIHEFQGLTAILRQQIQNNRRVSQQYSPYKNISPLSARPTQNHISVLIPSHDFLFSLQTLILCAKHDIPQQITLFTMKLSKTAEIFMISQVTH